MMELLQPTILVYLNRTSKEALEQSAFTERQIQRAFHIMSQMSYCDQQFPVFLFDGKTRTDEWGHDCVRVVLNTVWTQDYRGSIEYRDKLNYRLSWWKSPLLLV